jgi:hypothetical protein
MTAEDHLMTTQRQAQRYLAYTSGDLVLLIVGGIVFIAVLWRYVGWWAAIPLAALWTYGLLLRARARRNMLQNAIGRDGS